jgi:hypothetical protein
VHVPDLYVKFGHFAAEVRAHIPHDLPSRFRCVWRTPDAILGDETKLGVQDFENMTFASVDILYPTI